jgi:hypothetical protein
MLLFGTFVSTGLLAQTMPLVYNVENTGANYPIPYLPTFNQLPVIQPLPDPFEWADGRGRMSNYSDWEYRRNEIGAQIQNYEIGQRPGRPDTITASYSGGVLTVIVTVNSKTLTLTSQVVLPAGTGPFPAVIGMNEPVNYILPSSILSSNNIIQIIFNANQVTTYNGGGGGTLPSNNDPYYQLYPNLNLDITGQYSAWAWGVSRIIDGLDLVQNTLPVDLKHIAVAGCSYAGKMALFAGAFDERVALTIALESGGGGATSWRYSHTEAAGSVEDIDNTDYDWFENSMQQFSGDNVSYLPEDHHELMAMCAPRALYATANPSYTWLSNPSCYVASNACKEVYTALGIPDRFGFSIVGNHSHCQVPDNQIPEIGAFVDKFLLGEDTVNTSNISDFPDTSGDNYSDIDLSPWITWTNPTLSNDTTYFTTLAYPSNLQKDVDTTNVAFIWSKVAAAEKYFIQLSTDPTFPTVLRSDSTTTDTAITFTGFLQGKIYYWRVEVRSSAGLGPWSNVWNFTTYVPLPTMPQLIGAAPDSSQPGSVTFEWNKAQYADRYIIELSHVQSFSPLFYKDSTASDTFKSVSGLTIGLKYYWRVQSENVEGLSPWSDSSLTLTDVKALKGREIPTEYSISQNYPNPFNPTTKIEFALPQSALTRIVMYDVLGREIQTLVNKELEAGYYEINIDAENFPSGVYFYRIQSGNFVQTKKMILMK